MNVDIKCRIVKIVNFNFGYRYHRLENSITVIPAKINTDWEIHPSTRKGLKILYGMGHDVRKVVYEYCMLKLIGYDDKEVRERNRIKLCKTLLWEIVPVAFSLLDFSSRIEFLREWFLNINVLFCCLPRESSFVISITVRNSFLWNISFNVINIMSGHELLCLNIKFRSSFTFMT